MASSSAMRAPVVALTLLVLVVAGANARAEEAPDAAARTLAVRAGLPAPDAERAFSFEGYVLRDGAPYGRVALGARMLDKDRWEVRDAIQPLDPSGDRVLAKAMLGMDLSVWQMTYVRRNPRGHLTAEVHSREDRSYRVTHVTNDYENRLVVQGRHATATLSAVVLFLRSVPLEPGVWELPDLDANPSAGDPYLAPARLEIHRKAPWRVKQAARQAWIVSYSRGLQTLRLAFDAEDRALLGVDFVGLPFQFVPEGSGPVGLAAGVEQDLRTPIEQALERTRALRARLPAPREEDAIDFRGQVCLEDARVGSVWLRATPTSHEGRPAWSVLESKFLETGASRVESETAGIVAPDLTLLRGTRVDKRPAGAAHVTYERVAGGMRVVTRVGDKVQTNLLGAGADAMTGLVPVLLFLRHVPHEPAHYLLSGWDPRFAGKPKAGSGSFAFHRADVHVHVTGMGQIEPPGSAGGGARPVLTADCTLRSGRRFEVQVFTDTGEVWMVGGGMPKTYYIDARVARVAPDWYEAIEGRPASAWQAFIKFGRGYHRPRRDLLADAFHWPSMHAQAIAQGRYPEGTPLERIKEDWIETFVGMSKHRTKGDCDDLLFQILMTSRQEEHEDGAVTLHTLPVYGGHSYRMREIDGRWWIDAID